MMRILFCCFVFFLVFPVYAQEEASAEDEVPEESDSTIPEILDVHERDAEMFRIEFSPYFGGFIGDTLQSSYMAGAILDFRLTPKLSLGVDFFWSPITFDSSGSFGSTVTNRNLYAIQGMFTINIPAAFLSKKKVVETDFFTTIGGGIMRVNNSTRGDGFVGGGMKIYTSIAPWFAMRVEARNYFSTLNTPTGSDFTTDWTIVAGPTFMIPPRLF